MNPAAIEQAKLTATYLNGVAIAILAVGGFAPVATFLGGVSQQPIGILAGQAVGCLLASLSLHFSGRRVLRRLAN